MPEIFLSITMNVQLFWFIELKDMSSRDRRGILRHMDRKDVDQLLELLTRLESR